MAEPHDEPATAPETALPPGHLAALRAIVERLAREPLVWAVTGSTSFALQGVAVPVGDIDLQTDAAGAYAIARHFAAQITRPVQFSSTERIRSHYGALSLDGVQVELMGALQKRLPDGSWEAPVDIAPHRRWVEVAGLRVPVLDLAYEERAYRLLGRTERADLLRRHLGAQPPKVQGKSRWDACWPLVHDLAGFLGERRCQLASESRRGTDSGLPTALYRH